MLYRKADVFVLVYDITVRSSFEGLKKWLGEVNNYQKNPVTDKTKVMLIGNKADMEAKRAVSYEEGRAYAEENQMHFFETSAKTGTNVSEAFEYLVSQLEKQAKYHDAFERFAPYVQLPASPNVQQTKRCSGCSSSTSTKSHINDGRRHSHASFRTTEASVMRPRSCTVDDRNESGENPSTLSECMCTCIHVFKYKQ